MIVQCSQCSARLKVKSLSSDARCPLCGHRLSDSETQEQQRTPSTQASRRRTPRGKSAAGRAAHRSAGPSAMLAGVGVVLLVFLFVGGWALYAVFVRPAEPPAPDLSVAEAESVERPQEPPPEVQPEPVVDDQPTEVPSEPTGPVDDVALNIDALRDEQQQALKDEINRRIKQNLELVAAEGYGHVVVGRLDVEPPASPQDVIAQMEILDKGYFVDAVGTSDAPIAFWYPGYEKVEVTPRGETGSVEDLGEISLRPMDGDGGGVTGRYLVDGYRVPEGLTAYVEIDPTPLNVVGDVRSRTSELAKKLTIFPTSIEVDGTTGRYSVSGLPPGFATVLFRHAEVEYQGQYSGAFGVNLEPDQSYEFGTFLPSTVRRFGPYDRPDPIETEIGEDGEAEARRTLASLRGSPVHSQFQQQLQLVEQEVQQARASGNDNAEVVVGRVVPVPNQVDGGAVVAQDDVLDGGYFAFAVDRGIPLGFRLHGYQPLTVIPNGTPGLYEYLGVLRMQATPRAESVTLSGTIRLEGEPPAAAARVSVTISVITDDINRPGGNGAFSTRPSGPKSALGIAGVQWNSRSIPVANDGSFRITGLSPIQYSFGVSAPGFYREARSFEFAPGANVTLEPIDLYLERAIPIEYCFSEDGDFSGKQKRLATMRGNQFTPAALDDDGADPTIVFVDMWPSFRHGNLRMNPSSPCRLARLGTGSLEQYLQVDGRRIYTTNISRNVRTDEVYLIDQPGDGGWYLIRFSF